MLKFYTINAGFLVIFSLLLVFGFFGEVPTGLYVAFAVIWVAITVIGSFQIKLNYHLQSLNHNYKVGEDTVSITFDDGPNPYFTPQVLELLKKHDAKATFFIVGRRAKKYPELVKQIVAEGHTVGNHSYSHSKRFGFFSTKKITAEIIKTDKILDSLLHKKTSMFRPPYGVTNPNIKKALRRTGHESIGWSKRSLDTTAISEERIFQRITAKLRKGDIILLHDNSPKSIVVLERLLLFLWSHKIKSVPVDQLLDIEAYA